MLGPRSALLLFVVVVLSVAFAVPAEDLPETAYDESAPLVYLGIRVAIFLAPESVLQRPVVPGTVPACVTGESSEWLRVPRQRVGSLGTLSAHPLGRIVIWNFRLSDSLIISNHSLRC